MNEHLKRCYREGYAAGFANMATIACDWRSGTESHEAWWNGYRAGSDKRRSA